MGRPRAVPGHPRYMRYEDLIAGLLLIGIAVFALWTSRTYPVGSAANMGPGYFPRMMCWTIIVLGLLLIATNVRWPLHVSDPPEETLKFRPLVFIAASYVAFALTLQPLGLLPAILVLVVVASFAVPKRSLLELGLIILSLEALTFALWYVVRISLPLIGTN
jgi:putative tricarboxylic transport membrane protein